MAAPRRNIELKASDPDPERSLSVVLGLGARDWGRLRQRDTYFRVTSGRLKLREEEPGGAMLVQYDRVDADEARESRYRLVPEARVGHLGMYRDEEALRPVGYYENIPAGVEDAEVFVVDPMLATGGSGVQAVARLKRAGAKRLHFVCLVAAPEGVAALRGAHPDVTITTATIDRELDDNGYIRPGLGDAGDRIFGTDR